MATSFTDIIVSGSTNTSTLNASSLNATNAQLTNVLSDNFETDSLTTSQILGQGATAISLIAQDINIGSLNSNINVIGQLNYISADILEVKDPLITLNKGGTDGTAVGGGFEIAGSSNIVKASMKTDANLDFLITSPNDRLTLGNLNVNGIATINSLNISDITTNGNISVGNVLTTNDLIATGNVLLSGPNVAVKNNTIAVNATYYPMMSNILGGNGSLFTTSVFTYIQAGVPSINVNGQFTNNADAIFGNGNDYVRCRKNLNVDSVARVGYNDTTNLAGLSANGANLDVLGNIYTTTNVRAAQSLFSNGNIAATSGNISGDFTTNGLYTGLINASGTASIAGITTITNATASTTIGTGALVISGGIGVGAASNIGGILRVSNTTGSSSTTTGALVVSGGCGIGGSVNIGNGLNVGTNLGVTGTSTITGTATFDGLSKFNANVAYTTQVDEVYVNIITPASATTVWTSRNIANSTKNFGIVITGTFRNGTGTSSFTRYAGILRATGSLASVNSNVLAGGTDGGFITFTITGTATTTNNVNVVVPASGAGNESLTFTIKAFYIQNPF